MASVLVERASLFCSHNSFDVYDDSLNPLHDGSLYDRPADKTEWSRQLDRGYYCRGHAICFRTGLDTTLRFDFCVSDIPPPKGTADRIIALPLDLPTGMLTIWALDEGRYVAVSPGLYGLYLRAFNTGVEDDNAPDDDDVTARDDLEWYELTLVPGPLERTGILEGPRTTYGCVALHRQP